MDKTIFLAWERAFTREKALFEAWERWMAEMAGLWTAFPCVHTHFNPCHAEGVNHFSMQFIFFPLGGKILIFGH